MNPSVYLRAGDLITISHEALFLTIQSLTQSVLKMKDTVSNSINAIFLLTTQKCLESSIQEQKPLASYNDDEIYYNEPVLLYHLLSGKFLSYSKDIQNKASVQLINSFKENCKFSIKPIFKCQTIITRKIRNEESVVLSPAESFNHEGNISMVVFRNEGRKSDQSYVFMKKNESSKFTLSRKNSHNIPANSISNIYIYQLMNIETKKNLYMSVNQSKHKDVIIFEKNINEFGSYFDLRPKDSAYESIGVLQKEIEFGMPIYIHSWKQNKYLSINTIGDACLTQVPNEEAEFQLETYSDLHLNRESVVRVKHRSSQKYISINSQTSQMQAIYEVRLIDTCLILKVPIQDLRLNVFFNDAHKIIKEELATNKISYRNRKNIFKVLKELVGFMYGDEMTKDDFLSMEKKISCKLSSKDQKLLANIGIIHTLVDVCKIFIEEVVKQPEQAEFQKKDKSDQETIIAYTMMSLVGICNRNAGNTRILILQLPILYEALTAVNGIIESLYHLFKNSKELLLILENTSHKVGRKDIPSMELLINLLTQRNLEINTKCKILKLLEALIIVNHKQKILGHEAILLKSLKENKLSNVMIPLKFEELEQVINMRKKYEKELKLIKIQLQLLCSLCLNSNHLCFLYAKSIVPEDMIFRYLKNNLQPDFKEVFMRLLIDIYLSNLSTGNFSNSKVFTFTRQLKTQNYPQLKSQETTRRNLLEEEGEQMQQYVNTPSIHSKSIQQIKKLILEGTKKAILNEIIDSSFYMNIKSLRKFLDLRILTKDEIADFRLLLTQYINKSSKSSFKEEEKRKIILEILKIMADHARHEIEYISEEFIYKLKKSNIFPVNIYNFFVDFASQFDFFNVEAQKNALSFLPQLIKESIQHKDVKVFVAASSLFKMINERVSMFIKQLKDRIIIDSKWLEDFYGKINKLKQSINKGIQTYMNNKSDRKQVQFMEQQLNLLIKQLNYLFFQNSKDKGLNELVQNIFREMNFLEIIVNFLNESQEKFQQSIKSNTSIYSTSFEFISLYLQDNRQNFNRFKQKYLDIKFVFEHPDRGQIKFLNSLIKMPNARELMMDEIIECIILSFQHNPEPYPYTLLALINSISTPYFDKQRIELLVQKMLREPEIFKSIMKVTQKKGEYSFMWSFNTQAPNYHSEWLLYTFLMIKFFLITLEQSSQRTNLALEIEKYINLGNILELLKCQDFLINMSTPHLQGTLLKFYAIKLFSKIYLPLLQKQQDQIQNFLAYVHSSLQNISYAKDQHETVMKTQVVEEVILKNSDHGAIIFESQIKTKSNPAIKQFQTNFNNKYLSIVYYFPFLAKLLDTLINSNSNLDKQSTLKKEAQMQMDAVYRKMKDFVQNKLTYEELNHYNKQYSSAISNCQDIFKRKLGFDKYIEEEINNEDTADIEVTEYFINGKIENTIKCYKYATNDIQAKIYATFIQIFHSDQFHKFICENEESLPIELTIEEMQKITQMLTQLIQKDSQKTSQAIQLFHFFAKFNRRHLLKMNVFAAKEVLMLILSNQKDDPGNEKLCNYLTVNTQIIRWEVQKQFSIQKRSDGYSPYKEPFLQRICKRLESQKLLYTSNKINEQSIIYAQNYLMSYERLDEYMSIQLYLKWLRNMAITTSFKVKQGMYSILFMQIVDLLKSYCNFIKQFNSKYMSYELYNKINLCLQIIFHYIGGLTKKSILINYLIQRQIWNDLNLLLGLDDGWNQNLDELKDTESSTFTKIIKNQLRTSPRIYLKQAEKLYLNTKKNFNDLIPLNCYPLLPMKSLFGEMKSNVIGLLKQFKHLPLQIKQQLFSRIQVSIINKNIFEVYKKHNKLFNEYGISSVEIDIDYSKRNQLREIANNMVLENGIDLTSLKMHISTISGMDEIKTQYDNLRLQAMTSKKIQSAFTSLFAFFRDFFLIFFSCFLSLCRKKKNNPGRDEIKIDEKKMLPILNFFLLKIGRMEMKPNQFDLLSVDFMVRPECMVNKDRKQKFIKNINFISLQLKLESIYNEGVKFLLYFQNQIDFYRRFNKFTFVTFLTKNFDMLTYLNFAIILAQNIVLIANVNSKNEYFVNNSVNQPFVWLQIISTVIACLIIVAYVLKDVNLLVKNINLTLKIRAQSYGSNYNNYSTITKFGIKFWMVLFNSTFFYHLVYSLIVGLVFYNKLFVALLLLDIFFQIPTLKNLLMSIWRPKIELILAIASFVLVQYFFSIFMFFNFKNQTYGLCNTLGECFGFVFVTTYKAVGGFVGYLFMKGESQITTVDFFQIFQDVYVVLVFQIFFSLILAIIIDTFSLIRIEQTVRKEYLDGCCIVCNLDKTRFNSSTMSFKGHIAITHNIWNYFYYNEYIIHKSPYKRTPYERVIYLNRSANWLPVDASFDVMQERKRIREENSNMIVVKNQ